MTTPPADHITLTRDQLAALLAHHADVIAARWRESPGRSAWVAASALDSHAADLTASEETPAVAELLDSMLSFEAEHRAAPSAPADRDLRSLRRVVDRLAAHARGFQDVLDESDRGPWGQTVGADISELQEAVTALPALVDRASADAAELAELDREGAELVCVDQCGSCDACGMEPFGTPAEGWREAARFLRRTPRDSADFLGAVRGARLIEAELRRLADDAQQTGGQS
ncbi:hypothetical protein DCW30_05710 [Streptomyces alfalfae]|uniref:Uncharacterized protein n=1 Tax=Streptomyces alfalfae TaxID=1642299 RepID=A0ABM6GX83_9ACTN|nr:hypothetical protein [Streptomyces alfalfae]APY88203.1 hypothetical protein A7J05_23165 [Streptomyces alfalfae]AYA18598.1 hypothetical protein D3X13_22275 [Streptomyces fradiae]RXX46521.1 hypothetical protein DCW30_05710 [Streptomyces alfalfae]RZM90034.1 hypothetical protein D4104_25645 [Streptomyces alfalfae]